MKPIKIKIMVELENELIINVVSNAVASSHWYDTTATNMLDTIAMYDGDTLAEQICNALFDDIDIPVYIKSGDHMPKKLSSKGLNYKLQCLYNSDEFKWAIVAEMSGDGDTTSSDIVFQYMCFGEVIF